MTRKGVWLAILVASCVSSAFAQRGIQEFTSSGTFLVPTGVSTLRVDAYGAGGGGGGGDSASLNNIGGGGGSGAYNAGVITVSPGEVLTIMIGKGGAGGLAGNPGGAGAAGGATKILNPSSVVIFSANGGKGGQGGTSTSSGAGGAGGAAGTFGSIRHAGDGTGSGNGYFPVGFYFSKPVEGGFPCCPGRFGGGGLGGGNGKNGSTGEPGYLLIAW
jgi:hypothetical protein